VSSSNGTEEVGRSVWLWHPWGHDVQVCSCVSPEGTCGGAIGVSIRVAYKKQCLRKDQPHGWVETVGAGARKSVSFCCCLRWSVGCHQRLRSRCHHCAPAAAVCLSVFLLISRDSAALDAASSASPIQGILQFSSQSSRFFLPCSSAAQLRQLLPGKIAEGVVQNHYILKRLP
jgi:hypothetical protein